MKPVLLIKKNNEKKRLMLVGSLPCIFLMVWSKMKIFFYDSLSLYQVLIMEDKEAF